MMKKSCLLLVLVTAMVSFYSESFGQMNAGSSEVGGFVGFYSSDNVVGDRDSEVVVGGRYAYNIDSHHALEGTFQFISIEKGDILVYRANYSYHIGQYIEAATIPYVTVGFGGVTISPDEGSSDTGTVFNVGGGFKYLLTDRLLARIQATTNIYSIEFRTLTGQENETVADVEFSFGISFIL